MAHVTRAETEGETRKNRAGRSASPTHTERAVTGGVAAVVAAARGRTSAARTAAHDAGMATAEYAIATLAAVGFAGLLLVVLKGNEVKGLLSGIVRQALGG
ncbi:hypothetical protein Cfla_2773 [Cellulomonas flavigena DSM 20109]|uniref:DUF4244 domain-containing protein n=1 Tax=Cellulomonas flavigena (strain ATCC 482 / DSM 20109 / BCRC 11376 / JCM 18109 / NBRC 3775 / NCIMB 8073 / NRS 134) TaxID=446466 RepID=D5UJM0_CELFN|nr:DUF4244 domain-containing protein [Cellulomonas flavigena]ADG75658.1 hypothetical protein Cfla_2773 [Cellulomonas flavigena DSM 20109]